VVYKMGIPWSGSRSRPGARSSRCPRRAWTTARGGCTNGWKQAGDRRQVVLRRLRRDRVRIIDGGADGQLMSHGQARDRELSARPGVRHTEPRPSVRRARGEREGEVFGGDEGSSATARGTASRSPRSGYFQGRCVGRDTCRLTYTELGEVEPYLLATLTSSGAT